ncbi:MAG: 50S ribosomal protein L10, partial [Acidimicrobiia bacterium]
MPRPEKVQAVADIKQRMEQAHAVFLTEYAGLSVPEQQELRRRLRGAHSEFKVVKMTLARLAVSELGHDEVVELLTGPTALAFSDRDAAITAKALRDFAGDHSQLVIKGALLGGELLAPEVVRELAATEPRDVLLARAAGAARAPLGTLVGLMRAFSRDLAWMLVRLVEERRAAEGEVATDRPTTGAEAERP